jgi:NADP-dependent 3-hydroxy acid dehydrogenase YdfG
MSTSLQGRTALVTGATRGIGRAVAEALAEAGVRVWCLARSEEDVRAVAKEVGGEAVVADLADDASVWNALDSVQESIGGAPNIVVNAAGAFGVEACATETVNAFDEQIAVNLRGSFLVTRALLPSMLERGEGLIVHVGSVAGRRAFPGNAAYSASKFGLRGFHEVLLEEIGGTGVRATLLEPAATDTSLWDGLDPDNDPNLPARADMMRPEDVAEAVLFVASRPDTVRIPLLQIERS